MTTAPAGNYAISFKRIYRSQQTASGAAIYEFVAEIPDANTTYNDTLTASQLGRCAHDIDLCDAACRLWRVWLHCQMGSWPAFQGMTYISVSPICRMHGRKATD